MCRVRICLAICFLAWAAAVQARDVHEVCNWLGGRAFCGPGIALVLDRDGFFALRMEAGKKKPVQNVTGNWRLANDGIGLALFNRQDLDLKLSVGRDGLHASLGEDGTVLLTPQCEGELHFRVTGVLEQSQGKLRLTDAASGRIFPVFGASTAQTGKFAIADIEFNGAFAKPGRIIRHSAPVPRFYTAPAGNTGVKVFKDEVAGKFWLLPPDIIDQKATLRFSQAEAGGADQMQGSFEVTGQGLRLEGKYALAGENLTLSASSASLRSLAILGLNTLAQRLPGQFKWRLSSRGLELSGNGGNLLFLAP